MPNSSEDLFPFFEHLRTTQSAPVAPVYTRSEISHKRQIGAMWYLARLHTLGGHFLLGLATFGAVVATAGVAHGSGLTGRLGVAGIGLAGTAVFGTLGAMQVKDGQTARNLANRILNQIERQQEVRWCHKYTRIFNIINHSFCARMVGLLGWEAFVEYKGYNLWRRLQLSRERGQ